MYSGDGADLREEGIGADSEAVREYPTAEMSMILCMKEIERSVSAASSL